jgi:uncharacterized protein
MSFGLKEEYLEILKKNLQEVFGTQTDVRVYIFGSRATGKYRKNSDIDLALQSKTIDLEKKIYVLKERLEDSKIPYKLDIVNWDSILKDYLPQIKKDKKLIWSKKDIVITSPWRICPIGYHWVKEHLKVGNKDSTNSHCRKNPRGKDLLKADEIFEITKLKLFQNPKQKASAADLGFGGLDKKYDILISGWCAYWNDVFNLEEPLHPNHVKALMATESSFNQNPNRNEKHTAVGLLQLLPKTINLLSSRSKELKDHFVDISKEEAFDPNINICAGVRWLFRKHEIARKRKRTITWEEVIENYKGIQKQKGSQSDKIRNDFRKFYQKLSHK